MIFNSIAFAFFFPVVTLLYFAAPHRFRWMILILASCVFYAWAIPQYLPVLFAIILIDYGAGLAIQNAVGIRRKLWLGLSLAANLGLLSAFKYWDWLADSLTTGLSHWGMHADLPYLHLILPIGLSFHVFQSLAYTIEIYRGNFKAERHLGIYALYVLFYPQLVAGPIERPANLLHQFREKHDFDPQRFTRGIQLMAWGLFKKMVIADNLAPIGQLAYANRMQCTGPEHVVANICFAFQIYCDFSGYTDIALGAALVMGFNLTQNFRDPYLATSISDFWHRWHISLSTWFRDYVYFPLGGSRGSFLRTCLNVMVVFILSGLWHGAAWTFVIWGALHGSYLVFEMCLTRFLPIIRQGMAMLMIRRILVFSAVTFAWIFFRARNLDEAMIIVHRLGTGWDHVFEKSPLGFEPGYWLLIVAMIVVLQAVPMVRHRVGPLREWVVGRPAWQRWSLYYAAAIVLLLLGNFGNNTFIYFQF